LVCQPPFSDTEKRINQGWGAAEGTAELKAEEAAVNDATAEAAPTGGDWGAPTADAGEWGAPAAEATDAWTAPTDGAAPAAGATEAGAGKSERDGRPPRREREPEEEDNTLTLEQYIAQQKEKESSVVPKLEGVRKANEGADANIWKDVVALEKSEEDAYFVGKVRLFHLHFSIVR
jgi:plasminogen activator inhibitor 1 RNA-binding protein